MSFGIIASSYKPIVHPPTGSPYADLVLTHAPLLYWRLGDTSGTTAVDSSGYGRDGTYINDTPTMGAAGILIDDSGTSTVFESTYHQSAEISYGSWMNNGNVTITCTFLWGYTAPNIQTIASRYWDDTNDVSWFLYREGQEFKFMYRTAGGQDVTISSGAVGEVGKTYYVAAYAGAAGAGIRVYSLGQLLGSATGIAQAVNSSNRSFAVAERDSASAAGFYPMGGTLQEVAFFGSLLSTGDLDALAAQATQPQSRWVARTSGSALRDGTNTRTLTFSAASAGSFVMAVVSGPVTSTATSPGWTKRLSPVDNTELAVFTLNASGGETSLNLTHNGSNYPLNYVIYEFPAGTSWVAGDSVSNGDAPGLTGLPGTPVTVFAALSMASDSPSDYTDMTWGHRWIEDVDLLVPSDNVTDGAHLGVGWTSHIVRTSINPGTEGYFGPVYQYTPARWTNTTAVTFALAFP